MDLQGVKNDLSLSQRNGGKFGVEKTNRCTNMEWNQLWQITMVKRLK